MPPPNRPWPYPRWWAHRGAGRRAPENTLAAFVEGARCGYTAFECDVRLSADGEPFLLHDDTLERTTSGHGPALAQPWSALARLDAGRWHGEAHRGEPLPHLDTIAAYCVQHDHALNLELKPAQGDEARTGAVVARTAAQWFAGRRPPLLSSFRPAALQAALQAEPALPRALLLEQLRPGWLDEVRALDAVAAVLHHAAVTPAAVTALHAQGLRVMSYTVNDPTLARRLLEMGVDALITDTMSDAGPGAPGDPGP